MTQQSTTTLVDYTFVSGHIVGWQRTHNTVELWLTSGQRVTTVFSEEAVTEKVCAALRELVNGTPTATVKTI